MRIALVGNPNCGKTTMFNDLTGAYQYVGNWPGVTVEKKTGRLIKNKNIEVVDLPGIYSLSPYTLEEVITRDFIRNERPDVIINIIDATNLERNLYLTSQVLEMGVPTVVALNMTDLLKSNGISIDTKKLEANLGVPVISTSALKGHGLNDLIDKAIAIGKKEQLPNYLTYSEEIEATLNEISNVLNDKVKFDRYLLIKIFERDEKVLKDLNLPKERQDKIESIIKNIEEKTNDDSESIFTTERYDKIESLVNGVVKRTTDKKLTTSDKIDSVVTNRFLAIPIFLGIMWLVYYISISLFGDYTIGLVEDLFANIGDFLVDNLTKLGASEIMVSLINDGIVQSIGAVFTFVPQLMMLFFFLSILEDSGYMARIAFIMDKLFRKFGLSGKSFIPMLIGTGCSIPGVMATRTIETDADRRMTILLTPFIPCGAKLPIFAMFIAIIFNGSAIVAPIIYLTSILVVIIAGIILKRTKRFEGDPAPFVMELPPYRLPAMKNVFIHMWEKAKAFIIKAGTVILLACLGLWVLQHFTFSFKYVADDIDTSMLAKIGGVLRYLFVPLGFGDSWAPAVASITGLVAKEVVVATFASVGSQIPIYFSPVTAASFIVFTMFAAPCFAAIGAMKTELGSSKETLFTIGFQTGLAYVLAFLVNQIGSLIFSGTKYVEKVALQADLLEEASESVNVQGHIILYVLIGIIAITMIAGIIAKIKQRAKYKVA
ncbi:MAG: ferrous iron transport protein B [Ezakiella sp.]|nr:ferrous iron transport protein B [Ezakiella sp.]MDD7471371.1 ferrous iron transport protein B [Bacillota bacterium]MDY3922868.1 ferrous iron transport protein B [Ezakiella sp.]